MKKSILLLFAAALLPIANAAPKKTETKETPATEEKATKEKKPADPAKADEAILAAAKKQTDTLSSAQKTKLLDLLNKGDTKALGEINGIGEKRAATIIAKRPYSTVEDLALVDDIGEKTFTNVVTFGKGEQPAPVKKEKPAAEEKKEATKKMK
ncbi:MAG TPA: helix-hairpin-helix domain-containing protein [Luteolibacter sp.]|nr:helix-hairpin-helix domain-containing protein [Luteolibacter sp.]